MKNLFFIFALMFGHRSNASISQMEIEAKIKSYDLKIVTLEIAGEDFRFLRAKLGNDFKNLKVGEIVRIQVDSKQLESLAK